MLARPDAPLRLNIQLQTWDALLPYLRRVGWRGDFDGLSRLIEWLPAFVDSYTVALDVGDNLYPHVGLELFFPFGEALTERAQRFLAALAERGLCAPDIGAAILTGRKWIAPVNTKAAWADDLILRALRDPDQRLSTLLLVPSHVKLTAYPDGRIAAKGYLSFGHHWMTHENR
jgi:hypothetical protein